MKNKNSLYGFLVAVLTASLTAGVLIRTFCPAAILPPWSIPNLTAISLLVLVLDSLFFPGQNRNYGVTALVAALAFGLLPWAAGAVDTGDVWILALSGSGIFTAVSGLFSAMEQRISSGNGSRAALISGAIGIYLAAQGFSGMLPG